MAHATMATNATSASNVNGFEYARSVLLSLDEQLVGQPLLRVSIATAVVGIVALWLLASKWTRNDDEDKQLWWAW